MHHLLMLIIRKWVINYLKALLLFIIFVLYFTLFSRTISTVQTHPKEIIRSLDCAETDITNESVDLFPVFLSNVLFLYLFLLKKNNSQSSSSVSCICNVIWNTSTLTMKPTMPAFYFINLDLSVTLILYFYLLSIYNCSIPVQEEETRTHLNFVEYSSQWMKELRKWKKAWIHHWMKMVIRMIWRSR